MTQPLRSTIASLLLRATRAGSSLAGLGIAAYGAQAWAVDANILKSLEVRTEANDSVITVRGNQVPVFTAFRLESPLRLVIDIAGSDVTRVQGTVEGKGPVKQVSASQFADAKGSVSRIVVALDDTATYDIKSDGELLLVRVQDLAAASHRGPTAQADTKLPADVSPPTTGPTRAESVEDDHVVSSIKDEKIAANPATRVLGVHTSVKRGETHLRIGTDGEVGTYRVTELRDPPRLAIDFDGISKSDRVHSVKAGSVVAVRTGKYEGNIRLVVDLLDTVGAPKITRSQSGLDVVFGSGRETSPVQVASAQIGVAKSSRKSTTSAGIEIARVQDISFSGDESHSAIAISGGSDSSYEVSHPDDRTDVLVLHHANMARSLERSLDTSAFGGPVKSVSSFVAQDGSGDVKVVVTLDQAAKDEVIATKSGLKWGFTNDVVAEMSLDGVQVELGNSKAAGLQAEGPAYAQSGAPRKPKYTGRRVSFEFKDIDIHNLLRIIAEVAKKNIVVSDEVTGKITIRLRNVPWDQALDVILKSKNLDKDEAGNIIRILPAAKLAEERAADAKLRDEKTEHEEPRLRMISVNYATAAEMSDKIKDLLSKKGSVTVDSRTNTLIVKDVVASLTRVEGMVRTLDLQTPEVLIEARIVEANTTFSHDVGIQWGGQIGFAPAFGNPTGLVFPSSAVVTGASGTGTASGVQAIPNFAVDLPAATGTGEGGGLGFIFGSAGGAATLNLRIAAAESSGTAKTISAPKVTTLDNLRATISQGIAIPFSQFSASGVNTSFIEAKLELSVTPHVTQDGSVQLKIDATNNQPNAAFTGSNGQPSITKKEAHTTVLVKDGDTTVIGGIYTRTTGQNESIVPVLGKIPVLGYFFRHRFDTDSRTELLIFVTPHIVNRSQTVAVAMPSSGGAGSSSGQ